MKVRIDPPYERGVPLQTVAADIDAEVSAFNSWLVRDRKGEPLSSYERGILKAYLLYVAQGAGEPAGG